MDEGYMALASAVVEKAAKDYIKALKAQKRKPCYKYADEIASIERFFRSKEFAIYTSVDPEYLIKRLREAVS